MTSDRLQQRVDEVFVEAIELPSAKRSEFVANFAKDDPDEVRQRVMQLLAADERVNTKFAARSPLNLQDLTAKGIPDPRIGERYGDYVIQTRIASGGFGTVYRARRQEPYREEVAIKLLHRDSMAAPSVVQRVLREMQALSDLRHPNIVSQLHSNLTESGEPYIVMEFVDGLPLDRYCDQNQLAIDERLRLFQQICEAVQFAHEHGWLHRDLKPSNILVSKNGTPKLLDFGIAKLTGTVASRLEQTMTQGPVGTPQYMSPEQFAGQQTGPATDVYALGAILYELLSGHRAFDVMCRGINTVLLEQIQSAVKETIPHRPSTLVVSNELTASGESKEQVAGQRRSSPSSLKRCLEGDVDNIAMMALRKEPSRRYTTVADVSEDIQRWLDHRPVLARPDSATYRASKFVRRNRTALAVSVVVAACLAFAVVTLQQGREAVTSLDAERSLRHIETAQSYIDNENVPKAMVHFYAAWEAAGKGSPLRESSARLMAGWERYLGRPLGDQNDLRYAFDTNVELMAVSHPDGSVAIWNPAARHKLTEFTAGGRAVHLSFSQDSAHLVTVTELGLARCWDVVKGKQRRECQLNGNIMAAMMNSDHVLFFESTPTGVRLLCWNYEAEGEAALRELASREFHDELKSVGFVDENRVLVGANSNDSRYVELWDVCTLLSALRIVDSANTLGMCHMSPGRKFAVQNYRIGSIQRSAFVDLKKPAVISDREGKTLDIDAVGQFLLKHRQRLCIGNVTSEELQLGDDYVGLWSAVLHRSAVRVADIRESPRPHTVLHSSLSATKLMSASHLYHPLFSRLTHTRDRSEFSPDGQFIVFDNRKDDELADTRVPWLWTTEPFLLKSLSQTQATEHRAVAVDDEFVATITKDSVHLWGGETLAHALPFAVKSLTALAISANAKVVVAGDAAGTLHFLKLPSLEYVNSTEISPGQAIRSLSMSRDGAKFVVVTQNEATVFMCGGPDSPTEKARQVTSVERRDSAIERASFSSDGDSFSVASRDSIRVFYTSSGKQCRSPFDLSKQAGRTTDFVLDDDTSTVAMIRNGMAFLLTSDNMSSGPLSNETGCETIRLRGDGKVLAIGHADGTLQCWDSLTRRRLTKKLTAGNDAVRRLAFSVDGTKLVSKTTSGELRVWDSEFRPLSSDTARTAIEVLTGYDLDSSRAESYLSRAEWQSRYHDLNN